MTRPPPPRRHTGLALWACAVLVVTALGLIVGHGNTSAAAVRDVVRVPVVAPTSTENTLYAVLSPSNPATTPIHVRAPETVTRTLRAVSRVTVTAAPRTVFATRTATATVTAVRTVTETATQTVIATATVTATAAGSTP